MPLYFNGSNNSNSTLACTAIAVGVPSGGTITAGGTVTLLAALSVTYSDGIWLWFPAGAISGGSAGLYWVVMSSTTVGTVYINYVNPVTTGFVPTRPTASTVATGSGASYTQTTGSALRLINITLPAGTLTENSRVSIYPTFSQRNNANAKVITYNLDGSLLASFSNTTVTQESRPVWFANAGALNRQVSNSFNGFATSGTSIPLYTSVDTAVATNLTISANIVSSGTDFVVLAMLLIKID